ncbi:CTLH/CRA C-terminal to LisH motif domain - like 6 [Theobroma cacao]|nr:CTLH/CRA C-terminal to LisH motif domain - like 6 [Theobroma cacao]
MDIDPRQFEHVGTIVELGKLPLFQLPLVAIIYRAVNDNDIHNIVMSYLVHNCFKETVESFIACTGMKQPSDYLEDMEKRKKIFQFALEGNALMAIELTEQLATNLLEKNKDLHFDLLSLHFVELVCSRKCTEALEFAQTKLAPFDKEQKYVEKLEDFMALLAYEEPEKSPMFHLLSLEYRQHVAESLNRAILGLLILIATSCTRLPFRMLCRFFLWLSAVYSHANHPSYTAMERLIQQTTVVRQCLNQEHVKDGPPPFSLKDFLKS